MRRKPTARLEPLESRTFLSAVRFAVIGDYGYANPREQDVADLVHTWRPELIITTGDNNYPVGDADTIDANIGQYYHDFIGNYAGSFGPGSPVNRFFPSLGNHDWYAYAGGGQPEAYTDYFTLPGNERYYDFVAGPVHFFALDTDPNEPDGVEDDSAQAQWLQARLAASTSPWNIVYGHHSPYTSGSHVPADYMRWPFKEWGVDAVLTGHDHLYERIVRPDDGLTYIINGVGGNPSLYPFNNPVTPGSRVRYNDDWGAMTVSATDELITFHLITRGGDLIDSWSLSAATTAPASPANLNAAVVGPRQIDLTWTDASTTEGGFRLERAAGNGEFATIATPGPGVTRYSDLGVSGGTAYRYRVTAFNTAGDSPAAATAGPVTTFAGNPARIAAPQDFTAAADGPTRIDLSWDPVAGAAGYKLETSTDGVVFTPLAPLSPQTLQYSLSGLAPGTLYYFRLRAFDGNGDSRYVNTTLATPAPVPPVPNLGDGSDTGPSNWDDITNDATPTFTGGAPTGATVRLYANGVEVGSGVAAGWLYTLTSSSLPDGTYDFTVRIESSPGQLAPPTSPLAVTIDRTPPRPTLVRFNDRAASASVNRIAITFNEQVSAAVGGLTLRNDTAGQVVPASDMARAYATQPHRAIWTFPTRRFGQLAPGNYTATLQPTVTDLAGNPLDGNADGQGGDAFAFKFFQLPGDVTMNRVVDSADMKLILSRRGPATPDEPADLNADGRVDLKDYQILELNFLKTVPAPAAPAAAVARPAVAPRPVFASPRLVRKLRSDLLA